MPLSTIEYISSKRTRSSAEESCSVIPRIPEHSRSEQLITILIFVVSLAYLSLFCRYTTLEPDEGILLQGAQRILRGQVLYRDFFSFFTPGSYYLLALTFKAFGSSLLVARTLLAVIGSVFPVMTYLLARRVCSRDSALMVAGLVTFTTLPYRFLVLHNWDSTLWACLAVYCAVRLLECQNWKWGLALGSFASFTFIFEQSKGAGLILGLGFGFLLITKLSGHKLWGHIQLMAIAIGMAWPIAITFAYFFSQNSLALMLSDWFWPLQHYSLVNRVPYGYQSWSEAGRQSLLGTGSLGFRAFKLLAIAPSFIVPLLPLIAIGLLLFWLARTRSGVPLSKRAYYVLITSALSGLLLSVILVRADIIHFMYLLPLFGVVLAWIFDGRDMPGQIFRIAHPILRVFVVASFLLFATPLLMRAISPPAAINTPRGTITAPAQDDVIPYLEAHVKSGETILVYPYLPLYYYLTGTFSATPLDYFQPGMNTREQADEIIAQLATGRVRTVLFELSFPEKIPNSWPETPLPAIVQDTVADYIVVHYRTCAVLKSPSDWRFLAMVRKDQKCP